MLQFLFNHKAQQTILELVTLFFLPIITQKQDSGCQIAKVPPGPSHKGRGKTSVPKGIELCMVAHFGHRQKKRKSKYSLGILYSLKLKHVLNLPIFLQVHMNQASVSSHPCMVVLPEKAGIESIYTQIFFFSSSNYSAVLDKLSWLLFFSWRMRKPTVHS